VLRTDIAGSSYVGVFGRATAAGVVLHPTLDDDLADAAAAELDVPVVRSAIGGATTVGALAAGNEHGLVLSGRASDAELAAIDDAVDGAVARLPGRVNAAGNVVLANGSGAAVHPDCSDEACDTVSETLDVPVERHSLGEVRTVGTAAVATDRGVLCHPDAAEHELDALEDLLDVRADVGTVNYGAPMIGSGVIANASGYVVGSDTSGPELGRIEEALGFVDD
jgi:translation initiation factor 6